MEVLVPEFNLINGTPALICKLPEQLLVTETDRANNRYSTTRFSNIKLHINWVNITTRIVDISNSGCRAIIPAPDFLDEIQLHQPLAGCSIKLGKKVDIYLKSITPRSVLKNAVGFEFEVAEDNLSSGYFRHLIETLERREARYHKTEPLF